MSVVLNYILEIYMENKRKQPYMWFIARYTLKHIFMVKTTYMYLYCFAILKKPQFRKKNLFEVTARAIK